MITSISNEDEYQAALKEASAFFDNEPEVDSEEGKYFDSLVSLIEEYEAKHYPMEK